ncbi:MAG: hypothetical protein ACLP59_27150 [Bryobacteraceae bacterium]
MIKQIRYLAIGGFLAFAPAGFAQTYNMELTGVGNSNSYGDVYVSPYWGTVQGNGVNYTGYMICDDYTDESNLYQNWNATATNAGSLNGSELFTGPNAQKNYDAVAYLANQLMTSPNYTTYADQVDYSFAIWDIMDSNLDTYPDVYGAPTTESLISNAFTAVADGYVGTNVTVFTPSPNNGPGNSPSQEFLVVGGGPNGGPLVQTPEPASAAILGLDLLSALGVVLLVRRYRVQS